MTRPRAPDWDKVKTIVASALEHSAAERDAYVDEACGDDAGLKAQVRGILRHESDAGSFLETPPTLDVHRADREHGAPAAPERVGRYLLEHPLGAGGSGMVYQAVQDRPQRTVALKLMFAGTAESELTRRFERESEVLAQLHHPNIAHVYEAGIHADGAWRMPYIAMELVRDARTITAWAEERELSLRARIELFITVCRAVQHGHEKGIVHRDLKPPNILVNAEGHAKVIDFGVARVLDTDELDLTMQTNVGDIIGTLPYMSPEQCTGDPGGVDERADIYALGVVLFELLTGRLPLELAGLPLQEAIEAIRLKPAARLAKVAPALGRDLDAITARALTKEPARRYRTAAGLAADLQRFLDHQPVVARAPSAAYQVRLFARRHRVAVAAGMLIAAAMIFATALSAFFAVDAYRAGQAEAKLRDRAERINAYLQQILFLPDPHVRGEAVTVVEMVQTLAERLDASEDELPEVEATVRLGIGDTLLNLGRFGEAEPQFRRALELRRGFDPEGERTAYTLNELGLTLSMQGKHAEAEPVLREAVALFRAMPPEEVDLTNALGNLATALMEQGDDEAAESVVREVLERRREIAGPESLPVVVSMRKLGRILARLERLEESQALIDEAMDISRRTMAPSHPLVAACIAEAAVIRRMRGQHDRARELHIEAWDLARENRPIGSYDWIVRYEALVDTLIAGGWNDDARALLQAVGDELEAAVGPDDDRTVAARQWLTNLEARP